MTEPGLQNQSSENLGALVNRIAASSGLRQAVLLTLSDESRRVVSPLASVLTGSRTIVAGQAIEAAESDKLAVRPDETATDVMRMSGLSLVLRDQLLDECEHQLCLTETEANEE